MGQISHSSFLRFLLVGGSATLLHYAIMAALIHASVSAVIASATGYVLSTCYNYWASARFTFGGSHRHARSVPRFLVTALAGLGINQIALSAGIYFSLPIPLAQLAATAIVLFWNYFINATWTFARRDLHL